MFKFTKEEISLCRQIAEKHRKLAEYGDWYYSEHLKEVLLNVPFISSIRDHEIINRDKKATPLWTISDCLEFLREKCQDHVLLIHDKEDEVEWFLWMDEYKKTQQMGKGKTPLEACLKAVLAVLEEKIKCKRQNQRQK